MTTFRFSASMLTLLAAMACAGDGASDTVFDSGIAEGRLPDTSATRTSLVRMINALPGANGLSVTADNRSVFSGVDYRTVTQYQDVDETIARFRLLGPGRDTTIATNNEILLDGSRYTVIALPDEGGGVRLRVLKDVFEPDSGKARIRIVHAVQKLGGVDVMLAGRSDPLFVGVDQGDQAGFKDVTPGSTTITIRNNGGQLLRRQFKLEAGHAYTMVLTLSGNGDVDAITLDDRANR